MSILFFLIGSFDYRNGNGDRDQESQSCYTTLYHIHICLVLFKIMLGISVPFYRDKINHILVLFSIEKTGQKFSLSATEKRN